MTPFFGIRMIPGAPNPCDNAPAILTHTVQQQTAPTCGVPTHWRTRSTVTLSATLGTLTIERQRATDSGGTSWVFWLWTTSLTADFTHGNPPIGAAEDRCEDITKYFRSRARIVNPDDGFSPCGDGSWITATQINIASGTCPSEC